MFPSPDNSEETIQLKELKNTSEKTIIATLCNSVGGWLDFLSQPDQDNLSKAIERVRNRIGKENEEEERSRLFIESSSLLDLVEVYQHRFGHQFTWDRSYFDKAKSLIEETLSKDAELLKTYLTLRLLNQILLGLSLQILYVQLSCQRFI